MNVLGVDGGHHKWGYPAIDDLVVDGMHAIGLLRAGEARRQGKGVDQRGKQFRLLGCRGHGGLETGEGATGPGAFHVAYAASHAAKRLTRGRYGRLLQKVNAQIEGNGVKATGEHDPGATGLCLFGVSGDHLLHPGRFAAQVDVVCAGCGAGGDQVTAIELVGPDCSQHNLCPFRHGLYRRGVVGVGNNQWQFGRKAQFLAHGFQFFQAASGNRPRHLTANTVLFVEVFCDQLSGVPGCAVDYDSQFPIFFHDMLSLCKLKLMALTVSPAQTACGCDVLVKMCRGAPNGVSRWSGTV